MRVSSVVAALCLLFGMAGCGSGGSSDSKQAAPVTSKPVTNTTFKVTVDAPEHMLASLDRTPLSPDLLNYSLINPAYAAPVPGATIAVVYIGPNGVVTEVLDADSGLIVDDRGDGTYIVTMPGNPRVDSLLVADPRMGSAHLDVGSQLPDGTLYVPAAGEEITADMKSTAATRLVLNYTGADGWGGMTAQEFADLVTGVGKLAGKLVEDKPSIRLDELVTYLESDFAGWIKSLVKQASSYSLADTSGYVGEYFNMSYSEVLSTQLNSIEMQSVSTVGDWRITIPLPDPLLQPGVPVDLTKLTLNANSGGTANSSAWSDLLTSGSWSSAGGTASRGEFSLADIEVRKGDGQMIYGVPVENLTAISGVPLLNHRGYDAVAYGSNTTTGAVVAGFNLLKQADPSLTADGIGESVVNLAIKKSHDFDINVISGEYGALINWRTLTLPIITELRGRERFTASAGSFVMALQQNMDALTISASGSLSSNYAVNTIAEPSFTAHADLNGRLEGGWPGFSSFAASSADGRLVHAVLDHPGENTAGFVTFVKLDSTITSSDIGQREYVLIGNNQLFGDALRQEWQVSGSLLFNVGTSGASGVHSIFVASKWVESDYSGLLAGGNAEFNHGSNNIGGVALRAFDIANGEVSFNVADGSGSDYRFRGYLQEGGNLMVLHSYKANGTPGTTDFVVQDGLFYAVCVHGCETTEPPAQYSVQASVLNLNGALDLQLSVTDYIDTPVGAPEVMSVTADGIHTFARTLGYSQKYNVSILSQPASQQCTVANGSDVAIADVRNIEVTCINLYSIGGNVSGLGSGKKLDLQINAGESIAVVTDGPFTFPTKLVEGTDYTVTVLNQPIGQSCTVTNGVGTATLDVTDVQVDCVSLYTIGGNIANLNGQVELALNGGLETLVKTASGPFVFTTTLAAGTAYNVTVLTQPAGQICAVTNGSGTANADVNNISVNCTNVYTISGTASGLSGALSLQLNGSEMLNVAADGAFTFVTKLPQGTAYEVVLATPPANQSCVVGNASGTANGNVNNVTVNCTNLYVIGGTVAGLNGTVQLQLNGGSPLSVAADGAYSFPTQVAHGSNYTVAISAQPAGQTCALTNASGIATASVSTANVSCAINRYTIGGNASGLTGNVQLQLDGGELLEISANGAYTFASTIAHGTGYAVSVATQPLGQTCSLANASGTALANVSNVSVSCGANQYIVGGNITNLLTGENLQLQLNGGETLGIAANGGFAFATQINHGLAYNVAVATQPASQTCSVINGGGIATANVNNIAVNCSANLYTVGGTVSGLSTNESVGLQLNGSEILNVSVNDVYAFSSNVVDGSTYSVSVTTQPASNTCSITNSSGTVSGGSVTNVNVSCSANQYSIGGNVSGLAGTLGLTLNGAETLNIAADGGFTFAGTVSSGSAYGVTVSAQPTGQTCSVSAGNGVATANVTNVQVSCGNQHSVGGSITGLQNTVYLQLNAGEVLPVTVDGTFQFSATVADGAAYNVTVQTQPVGQTCTVDNGSGSGVANADINSVTLSCSDNQYSVGGSTVSLTGTVQLQLNGAEILDVSAGSFSFVSSLTYNTAYEVTILTQPSGQQCSLTNASGTMPGNAVTDVVVNCAEGSYIVSGSIAGLSANGLELQLNLGSAISVASGSTSFTFATQPLASGALYDVTVATQPAGQTCTVTNGSGTMPGADLGSVSLGCADNAYVISGTVTGLSGVLQLQLNGAEAVSVDSAVGTGYAFTTTLAYNQAYSLVLTAPAGQVCSIASASGTMPANDLTLDVICDSSIVTVSGSVSGINGTLGLSLNGVETLPVSAAGSFSFLTELASGSSYNVTVATQPAGQICTLNDNTGTAVLDVTNISVVCVDAYSVGGTVVGLNASVDLQLNGNEILNVPANGAFTFSGLLVAASSYDVSIETQPAGQLCTVSNGSGTVAADVNTVSVSCVVKQYSVSGMASNINGTVQLLINGGDALNVTVDGAFGFATPLVHNTAYDVTINSSPAGQNCTLTNHSGVATAEVGNLALSCSAVTYTVGGAVSGLKGSLQLTLNGNETLALSANGAFNFTNTIAFGGAYTVAPGAQPAGQICTVSNASGTVAGNVTTVNVSCSDNTYSIGGSVTGLSGNVQLSLNGTETLDISANGVFTFLAGLNHNNSYTVGLVTQPTQQICSLSNNTGIATADVVNVTVNCTTNAYSIGGDVSGLNGSLALRLNGLELLNVAANGPFTFTNTVQFGSAYSVSVATQPAGQSCSVSNANGTAAANVSSVLVACTTNQYVIGGSVSGITGNLQLQLNTGEIRDVTAAGAFSFTGKVPHGSAYDVVVVTNPTGQSCSVSNGSGSAAANVSNVSVSCSSTSYTVSGTVSGLSGGLQLQINGGEILPVTTNGSFSFATILGYGDAYSVAVRTQPTGQNCTLGSASGTITSSVSNVTISCSANQYSVGGRLTGAAGPVQLQLNGSETIDRNSDGVFVFATKLDYNASYTLTVVTQPVGQVCSITSGSGNITADVQADVNCSESLFSIGGTISGLNGNIDLQLNGGEIVSRGLDGAYNFTGQVSSGSFYSVAIAAQPAGQICTLSNQVGEASADVSNVNVSCQNQYSIGGLVSGLLNTVYLQLNGGEIATVTANGAFAFNGRVSQGAGYSVAVETQALGQTCSITNGTGTAIADVADIAVSCADNQYVLSGSASGLTGTVDLDLNGVESLSVIADGSFTFVSTVAYNTAYSVTIPVQPVGQTCSISNGSGTVPGANITDIVLNCTAGSYLVSGTVTGLLYEGLELALNAGTPLSLAATATDFAFTSQLVSRGTPYSVQVTSQPLGQSCSVANGSGTMPGVDVSNLVVSCVANGYTVSGNVTGLNGTLKLTLNGVENAFVDSAVASSFTFTTTLQYLTENYVIELAAPAGQICSIDSASGTMPAANLSLNVVCSLDTDTVTVSGSVAGLVGSVELDLNGAESVIVAADGPFAFVGPLANSGNYTVAVKTQPVNQLCTVTNGSGTALTNVTDVTISCENAFSIGGTVAGLGAGSVELQLNADEILSVAVDGTFTFTDPVVVAGSYAVSVVSQPTGQSCIVTNGSGTVAAQVNDISVNCTLNEYAIGGNASGVTGTVQLQLNGTETLDVTADGVFGFITTLSHGSLYDVTLLSQPAGQSCTLQNASGNAMAIVANVALVCGSNQYRVGGAVTGLNGSVELELNASEVITVNSSGAFEFATALAYNNPYSVIVSSQPLGQTCNASNNSGTIATSVTTVAISCANNSYSIGGTVSGVSGNLQLQLNGSEVLEVNTNGAFAFVNGLNYNAAYNVIVAKAPKGQVCSISNPSGTAIADISSLAVSCTTNTFAIGGSVSGLSGSVDLQLNGLETLNILANGSFTFTNLLAYGTTYNVVVNSKPTGQSCSVINGSGTTTVAVTSVAVNCVDDQYSVGGSVIGLSGTVQLGLNGNEILDVNAAGAFTFVNTVTHNSPYAVSIISSPEGQSCSVTNGSGTATANIANVSISCSDKVYTVAGNVTGLSGTVQVQLNAAESLIVAANGSFTFASTLSHGDAYSVGVLTQPTGQTCTVSNSTGTISANISNVAVACKANQHSVGGTVSGSTGTVQLRVNDSESIDVTGDGIFTFSGAFAYSASYSVSVITNPIGQTCSVANGSGTVSGDVNTIAVSCSASLFSIGGSVSGLSGSLDLQINGGEVRNVLASGPFSFVGKLAYGTAYNVVIIAQPAGQSCSINNGGGAATTDVTTIAVNCIGNLYSIGGNVSGLTGTVQVQLNGTDTLNLSVNAAFNFAGTVAHNSAYSVAITGQPTGQSCTLANASGTALSTVSNVQVNCSNLTYTVGGAVSGATGPIQLLLNGTETLNVAGSGAFTFATPQNYASSYNVTIATQPAGQICSVANAAGSVTANVTNVAITCITSDHSIGGTVSGLVGLAQLQLNAAEIIDVTTNGAFEFSSRITYAAAYAVAVITAPAGQSCSVVNASGNATADVSNVAVTCVNDLYTIGGSVSGLAGGFGGTLQLQLNAAEILDRPADGVFTFATTLSYNKVYDVKVATQPLGQTCTVASGYGTTTADIAGIAVTCVVNQYSIGGSISGLASGESVELRNGMEVQTYLANGAFTISPAVNHGSAYDVQVSSQPVSQTCAVSNGSGTASGNVNNVAVTCVINQYAVGGTISGLNDAIGETVQISNGSDVQVYAANGPYTISTLDHGSAYNVQINTQPVSQTCSVINGTGSATAVVNNVNISCVINQYDISVTVSGLAVSEVNAQLQLNATETLAIPAAGVYTFTTKIDHFLAYDVSVATQPVSQTCVVTNGSGNATANVSDILVNCTINQYTVGGTISGLNDAIGETVQITNGADVASYAIDGAYTISTLDHGTDYDVQVSTQPISQTCSVSNGAGKANAIVNNVNVACAVNSYTIGGTVTGLDSSELNAALQLNGGEILAIPANGTFTFAGTVDHFLAYNVTVSTQPVSQTCSLVNASGTATAPVSDIAVNCIVNTYTVGGTIAGLATGESVQVSNGLDVQTYTADGAYTISTLDYGTDYDVNITSQPVSQTCSFDALNDSGKATANVSDINITCAINSYSIAGTVSGLDVSEINAALQLNGTEILAIPANGPFSFLGTVDHSLAYSVTVSTQPVSQTCSVTNGSGTAIANVTDVAINCAINQYTVGGTVSGLAGGESLQITNGTDVQTYSANGAYTISTINHDASYNVQVTSQPVSQTCSVSNGAGTAIANVSNVDVACAINSYSLGGTVSGMTGGTLILDNGVTPTSEQTAGITANGAYTFPTAQNHGTAYTVTVQSQPTGQTCTVSNAAGSMTATVANIDISCAPSTHTLGGNVSGLNGTVVLDNGLAPTSETVSLSVNGPYVFPSVLVYNSSYTVSVQSQPVGQTCSISNGGPLAIVANVNNVDVSCTINTHTLGGTVSGLSGTVILSNGVSPTAETVSLTTNAAYTFPTEIAYNTAYAVSVQTQPVGQTCSLSNATGTMTGEVNNVNVTCAGSTHTMGGTVSGLSGTVVINNGSESHTISADGAYTFPSQLAYGTAYTVTVSSQPAGQSCSISNATGTVAANVSGVDISCSTAWILGGTVSGLSGTVVLDNGLSPTSETVSISAVGAYSFANKLANGASYTVTVATQPVGQTCSIANAGPLAITADVTNVDVTCSVNTYTLGGTVSGLTGTVILDNGLAPTSETVSVSAVGAYTFPSALNHNSSYTVTVQTQPVGQTCTVSNAGPLPITADVANVNVSCSTNIYSLGGNVSGLTSGTLVLDNGVTSTSETVSLTGSGTYSFPSTLDYGSVYAVTVQTQPVGQTCTITNGSGTMTSAVTNVNISCAASTYSVGGSVTGINGTIVLNMNSGAELHSVSTDGPYSFPTRLAYNSAYTVSIQTQPTGQSCNLTNATGTVTAAVSNVDVSCTTNTYTLGGTVSGLSGTVILSNGVNPTAETVSLNTNAAYSFPTPLAHATAYAITVQTQPTGQTCSISSGSGTITAKVSNVGVNCVTSTHAVGGTVTGINGTIVLNMNSGAELHNVSADGLYSFPTRLAYNSAYTVSIQTQPTGQSCNLSNPTGTAITADVTNVDVACTTNTYALGGVVSGLSGTVLLSNGVSPTAETVSLTTNAAYTFPTALVHGTAYAVTVQTQPTGQTCSLSNASGTLNAAVSNVNVSCTTSTYSLGGTVSGLSGTVILDNGVSPTSATRNITTNGAYSFAAPLAYNTAYAVTVQTQPTGQTCSVSNGSGTATAAISNVNVSCSTNAYNLGGTVSGLSGTVLLSNGVSPTAETVSLTTNAAYTFPTALVHGTAYAVTVQTQPTGQTCSLSNASGTLNAAVSNVNVSCTTSTYSLGGTVSGLSGTVILDNGVSPTSATRNITTNGAYSFAAPLPYNTAYAVTVQTQPTGQTCSVSNGSGTATAAISNVNVSCSTNAYNLGGTVSGLSGTVLLSNGVSPTAETVSLTTNAAYTFPTALAHGTAYAVTVQTQPTGQTCSLSNASGTLNAAVSNVNVSCATSTYSLGGTVSGLSGTVILDNGVSPTSATRNITTNGAYSFAAPLAYNTAYAVTVQTQPTGQTCSVSNGSGTATAPISNVDISCSTNAYNLGGTVSGLSGTVLLSNGVSPTAETVSLTTNAAYTFPTALAHGTAYAVTVQTQPTGQTCSLSNASGTLNAAVSNVNVICNANTYSLGGTISGLTGSLVLNNGVSPTSETVNRSINGAYTFATPMGYNTAYVVTVQTQPTGQTCSVSNGSGTVTAVVSNVDVSCSTNAYNLGGTVSGLTGTVILDNGVSPTSETVSLSTNAAYNFPTALAHGTAYAVTVQTQPVGQTCSLGSASGTMSAVVSNVDVTCSSTTHTLGGTVTGLAGTLVLNNGSETHSINTNGAYTFPSALVYNTAYTVVVQTQPGGQVCTVSNAGPANITATVSNVDVNCVASTHTLGGTVTGLTGTLVLNNGSETHNILANGGYVFPTPLAYNTAYTVAVQTQPAGQTCSISNAGPANITANVSNVDVNCLDNTVSIGGTLSGLNGTVTLQNNAGDNLLRSADGAFTFATEINRGSSYNVTVLTQPATQSCTVTNGTGTASTDITTVNVSCVINQYTIGGSISGLAGGESVQLTNGADVQSYSANNVYVISTIDHGTAYNVQVTGQPLSQTCTVSNASGSATADVTNVNVSCVTNTYVIGGNVSGLNGSVTLRNNGGDDLIVSANGAFSFASQITHGNAYNVTVFSQPYGQQCSVSSGSGTASGTVSSVVVSCEEIWYMIRNYDGSSCIELNSSGTDIGTATCNSPELRQRWKLEVSGSNWRLRNLNGTNKCIYYAGISNPWRAQNCDTSANKDFTMQSSSGYYRLKSSNNNMCMYKSGSNIIGSLGNCGGLNPLKWRFYKMGDFGIAIDPANFNQ